MNISNEPLPSHLENFLDWLDIEKGLSSNTQENYARYLGRFFSWLRDKKLHTLKPHELTLGLVREYRAYLARRASLRRSTQNCYLIALRNLLMYFIEHDISSLPAEKIKLARQKEEKEVRFLTREQVETFFEGPDTSAFRGLRDRAIIEVLFSTGLRIAELVALNRNQISMPKNLAEELELIVTGKGGRIRTVYFSKRSLEWLQRYLSKRGDMHEALFVAYRSYKTQSNPSRISPRAIQIMFKRNAMRAGIPLSTTPHVMRHSFATDLVAKNIDIRTIQEFLGHKNISATQIYAHLTKQRLRDIHKKIHGSDE